MRKNRVAASFFLGILALILSSCGGHLKIVQPIQSVRESWEVNASYYRSNSRLWVETERNNETAVGYGDFNRDGYTDVVKGSISGTEEAEAVHLFLSDGSGTPKESNDYFTPEIPKTVHARKIIAADFNGDGTDDFLILDHGYDQPPFPGAQPWLALSTPSGLDARKLSEIPAGFQHSGSAADVDSDGDADVFITDTTNGAFFLINDGPGNFTLDRKRVDEPIGSGYYTSELIDLNKDGYYDLIVAGHEHEGAQSVVYWGSAAGVYSRNAKSTLPADGAYPVVLDIDSADLDGDGTDELILTRTKSDPFYEGYFFQILKRLDSTFTDITLECFDRGGTSWIGGKADWIPWIKVHDFDGDGDADLVVDDKSRNLVWFNDGGGSFTLR